MANGKYEGDGNASGMRTDWRVSAQLRFGHRYTSVTTSSLCCLGD